MDVAVGVGGDAEPVRTSTFRGTPRLTVAAAASAFVAVGGDDCCWCCCCRKTFGPGRYPGGTPARSKGRSYKCKLVALAGAAVGSAGVMIVVVAVCSGLFGRSVGLGSHCFVFGDLRGKKRRINFRYNHCLML